VEVHDGKEGVEVDALVVQADLATPIPSSMVEVAELPGAAVAGEVLADANGQFDYRGVMGENQVFVHKGTIGEPARSIGRTWYFNDGDAWVYEAFQKDGLQVVVNGDGSPLGDTVVRDPEWSQGTQDVFTVLALPASDPEPSKESVETETAEGAGVPTEVNPDPALLVLKNATELVRGHEVQRVEVLDEGLGLFVRQDDAWHAFAGERLGPGFEQVSLEPGPVWGEKLNSSRYVAGFDGDWYVAAHNLVRGPFDEVTALFRSGYQNDSVVYSGVRGQVERAFIDDDLVAEAESVGVYEDLVALAHGDTLLIPQIDANQLELVGPDNTYSLVDNPEPVENVLALTNKDSTRLVIGDEMVEAKWVFFDVRLETAEDDSMATLSWVDGTLNRDKATLELVASTLNVAVPAGGLDSVFPLADIPLEGEVEAEIQIEESTEGEDERPSDPVSAESTDADGNTAG